MLTAPESFTVLRCTECGARDHRGHALSCKGRKGEQEAKQAVFLDDVVEALRSGPLVKDVNLHTGAVLAAADFIERTFGRER